MITMQSRKINKKIIVSSILLILAVLIYILIETNRIYSFDNEIYSIISKYISEPITILAKIVTTIGSAYVVVPICIVLMIALWKKGYGKYILLNLFIVFLSNQFLKFIIQRPRPTEYNLIIENGFSFPSGHSMVSMAFYGYIIYLIYKNIKNNYLKWGLITILALIIILIGISRIYLGVHYASDVLAGFLISIAYLILFTNITNRK